MKRQLVKYEVIEVGRPITLSKEDSDHFVLACSSDGAKCNFIYRVAASGMMPS